MSDVERYVQTATATMAREARPVRFKYRVDVSGSAATPSARTADVRIALDWDDDSDYDLYVYDSNDELLTYSYSFNWVAGAGEAVFLPQLAHCTDLRVDVVTYLGLPTNEMTLDTSVGGLE